MCERQEYQLIINDRLNGKKLDFPEFPELDVTYINSANNLCPSYYSSAVCIQAGSLSIRLEVNGKLITLDSEETEKEEIIIDNYKFKGLSPLVKNKSKSQTYIIISIEKCHNNNDKHIYNLGQPFILEFHDNPSTGYTWNLKVTPGIKIIKDTYSNKCEEGITGCGGTRTFILEETKRGEQMIIATHGRSWDPTTNTQYKYLYNIV